MMAGGFLFGKKMVWGQEIALLANACRVVGIEPPRRKTIAPTSALTFASKCIAKNIASRCVANECAQQSFAHSLPAGSLKPANHPGVTAIRFISKFVAVIDFVALLHQMVK